MLGASFDRTICVPLFACLLAAVLAAAPCPLSAQEPADQPALPATGDASPPAGASTGGDVLPPYAPSNSAASGLLPANPPLPPHPSVPDPSLLPDGPPAPAASPLPLPLTPQADTPAAPGAAATAGGATTTSNTDAVRRFQYAFRISTGVTYDDNIFLIPQHSSSATTNIPRGASRADFLFVVDPSFSLGYGDFLTRATNFVEFDYTADVLLYASNTGQDTVQHIVNFQGAYHFAQVTLSLSQGIQLLDSTDLSSASSGSLLGSTSANSTAPTSQVNLDTSRRTRQDIYTTHVDANYAFSDKTSVDVDGSFTADEYATLISSESLVGDFFFNYSPTGKTTFGLGVTGGYTIQDKSAPDEYFQQINLRLSYTATSKLSFTGSVGIETREASGSSGVEVNPIFNFSISYAPTDTTTLALTASRTIQTSAVLTGTNYDSTGFSFSITQTLFQRASARLSVGYTNSSYTTAGQSSGVNTGSGIGSGIGTGSRNNGNRSDDYYFIQPSLDYSLRDNLSGGIFFIRRQDFSSPSSTGFVDNQVGVRVSFSF